MATLPTDHHLLSLRKSGQVSRGVPVWQRPPLSTWLQVKKRKGKEKNFNSKDSEKNLGGEVGHEEPK